MDIHRLIRHRFKTYANDNLPHTSIRRSRVDLAKLCHEVGFKVGVEIGVCTGKHSQILCENIPGVTLTCIDPWLSDGRISQERQDAFAGAAAERLRPYNATILRIPSMDALAAFTDDSLDFVHVDGNHTYDHAAQDIIFWSRKLRVGGMMSVHDYCPFRWGGVVEAVDAYTKCHHIDPWYVIREMQPTAFWIKA
jgi:hypothetical protein